MLKTAHAVNVRFAVTDDALAGLANPDGNVSLIGADRRIRYFKYAIRCTGWWPVGIDHPHDDDTPVAATSPDQAAASRTGASEADAPGLTDHPDFADTVDRAAYYAEHRATVEAVYLDAARERWTAARPELQAQWREYARHHVAPPDTPPDTRADIDAQAFAQVEQGCKQIRETEENTVTPAMKRIEADDPERELVGLDFRCKGQDRIMEKVAAALEEQPNLAPADALALVKDAIRYTFQYTEQHYTEGVGADLGRLKDAGFELIELRNSWRSEEYKGINSRWRVPDSGQLFEVQFHTQISFEAKQLTHEAYERIRSPATQDAELRELRAFQRQVNAEVPHPPRVMDVPEHP